jgi:hypothetical protein
VHAAITTGQTGDIDSRSTGVGLSQMAKRQPALPRQEERHDEGTSPSVAAINAFMCRRMVEPDG